MNEEQVRFEFERYLGKALLKKPLNKEEVKVAVTNAMQDVLSKYDIDLNETKEHCTATIMWDDMNFFEKFKWRAFRWWPFKRIAERARNTIDFLNHEHRKLIDNEYQYEPPFIEYPRVFHPNPKSVILFNMRIRTPPIVSVTIGDIKI